MLAQDYPAIEYMVVDGASSDGSPEIIERYADNQSWLSWWVSEPDRGQAEAINKGFSAPPARFVAWLNSDDLYLPGAVGAGRGAPWKPIPALGMVFGDALTIDLHGQPLNRLVFGNWGLAELMRFRIICQPAVFMRRSVIEQAGYLDPAYHMMLDHQLWLRMARLAPVQYIGGGSVTPLAAARSHPAAKNVAVPERFADESLRLLAWMQSEPRLAAQFAAQMRAGYAAAPIAWSPAICWTAAGRRLRSAITSALWSPGLPMPPGIFTGWPMQLPRWPGLSACSIACAVPAGERRSQALAAQLRNASFPEAGGQRSLEGWPGICLNLP